MPREMQAAGVCVLSTDPATGTPQLLAKPRTPWPQLARAAHLRGKGRARSHFRAQHRPHSAICSRSLRSAQRHRKWGFNAFIIHPMADMTALHNITQRHTSAFGLTGPRFETEAERRERHLEARRHTRAVKSAKYKYEQVSSLCEN